MKTRNLDRLADYVRLIARKHGGLEGLNEKLRQISRERAEQVGLESVGAFPPADPGSVETACRAIENIDLNRPMSADQLDQLEAIIDADLRPAIDIVDGTFTSTHPLWTQLSTDAAIRMRIEQALASIGRIELPGHPRLPYGGTGFIVGNGLVMTNRHVAEIFADGVGSERLTFRPNARAGIDFLRESNNVAGPVCAVRRIVMVHPYWDMALLAVDGLATRHRLKLSLKDARDLDGHDIAVIGYPAFDPRNEAGDVRKVYRGRFGVKRLQPGELRGGVRTGSFGKPVQAATHDSSTLGGCSGAAVLDLSTGSVLGLHFGGRYRERNFAVPSAELARDTRVTQAGVDFDSTPSPGATDWAAWWTRADSGESLSLRSDAKEDDDRGEDGDDLGPPPSRLTGGRSDGDAARSAVAATAGALRLEIPIVVTVTLGDAVRVEAAGHESLAGGAAPGGELLEAMVEPYRDPRYAGRKGYDEDFLDETGAMDPQARVPMPTAQHVAILAPTKTGEDILHYQNFSIRMHAARRLALVTASNVTAEGALRRPEAGRDYTRAGLSGLGKNDVEQWFADPRLDAKYQLPDVFFTKDRKAFDKGHVVRRDDVAWGRTYATLRRANGDTYHVTNCSPQVAGFNQSAKGEENWGDLENQILAAAKNERLCVFAGPVLDPTDRIFYGVGTGGAALRARIPSRFWKVIVSRVVEGIAPYGFVLEQDLANVEFEYVPAAEFIPKMVPIADLAEMTGVAFDPAIVDADQFDAVGGIELAFRVGVERAS